MILSPASENVCDDDGARAGETINAESTLVGVAEDQSATAHAGWIESELRRSSARVAQWSKAVAVGRRGYVEEVRRELGPRARYRKVADEDAKAVLRDCASPYGRLFAVEMRRMGPKTDAVGGRS